MIEFIPLKLLLSLSMKYYLVKTDPDTYSIDNLVHDKVTTWDGVNNAQAVIFLKQMHPKDMVLVYHSQGQCTIVGLAEVVGNSRPDLKNPRSWLVDFKFIKRFDEPYVTLQDIKATGKFQNFRLVTQSRLSVMPVPENVIEYLKKKGLPIPSSRT